VSTSEFAAFLRRPSLTLAAIFVAAYAGFFTYSYAVRKEAGAQQSVPHAEPTRAERVAVSTIASPTATLPAQPSATAAASTAAAVPAAVDPQPLAVSAETAANWMADATGYDREARALTVVTLATAPKAQATPILQRVLRGGALEDMQLALQSLRTLAVSQGDADGRIREVLRQTIYDGGTDEAILHDAQAALDDIERSAQTNGRR